MPTKAQYKETLSRINDMSSQTSLAQLAGRFGYPDLRRAFSISGLTRPSYLDLVRRLRNRFIRDYAPGSGKEWPEE